MKKTPKTIPQLYAEHKGKVSDKWTSYLSEYDNLLDSVKDNPIRLLEIGVQNGGGLEIWSEYFKNGLNFIGCDIDPACATLQFNDLRISLVVGDANTDDTQNDILSISPNFDIVIDDGSHHTRDIVRSFIRYFPHLVDGGIYIVEDLHTSYWKEYEGGLFDPLSSISFFKRLVDIINADHWGVDRDPTGVLVGFNKKYGVEIDLDMLKHIHSIKFVNSLCIILKSPPSENELGVRFVTGSKAYVNQVVNQLHGSLRDYHSQATNPWSTRICPPDEELPRVERQVKLLKAKLTSRNDLNHKLETQLVEKEQQLFEREQKLQMFEMQTLEKDQLLNSVNHQLNEILISEAWKAALLLRRLRVKLFPPGSSRNRIIKKTIPFFRSLFHLLQSYRKRRDLILIRNSSLFDKVWYFAHNPDLASSGMDPAVHYLLFGGVEGRDPGPDFSAKWYLDTYPDVMAAKVNPLVHYIRFGKREGRLLSKRGGYDIGGGSHSIDPEFERIRSFNVVPYYLDPLANSATNNIPRGIKVAIHLHLFYQDMLDQCILYLNNIPVIFDLYVSIGEDINKDEISKNFQKNLTLVNKIIVKNVPNRGRDLAPLIIDFGKDLVKYEFIGHIHTKKSPHLSLLDDWFTDIMTTLLGSKSSVDQIFKLLLRDARFVYPAPNEKILIDKNGWGDNYEVARKILPNLINENIDSYPFVEFPQGSMFWAKSEALRTFLGFPLKYSDFPLEPLPSDGTIAHVLERLLLIAANKTSGRNYRIYLTSSVIREPLFETQIDYSNTINHKTVKVLSYYLPQFYAIPENDKWHGKGFTEWNNVRKAFPLFYGHYQQRIPNQDLGYYSLNTPETLQKQVELMERSGVYGQIFYHYWFNGKLILEKPSQMLLAEKSIRMPFCFCWANENWTKKWDGNEDEVLLAQNYSEQDAGQFINYLIPFLKDDRYIRIDDRPVIFIYRISSIPDFSIYNNVWKKICNENGIKDPFVIAVLTRGATNPEAFGVDAGCERVLHDWTNGNVKEIKNEVFPFWPINGSVLNFDDVADYYMGQTANTNFTYFRSIIPSWDNSPRYGSEGFIVTHSTPGKFQEWMEKLVGDAENRLPEGKRFVIVNAWNEWAESAFLEPDDRFGYAYLNSIGRSLSGIKSQERDYLTQAIKETTHVHISFGENLIKQFQRGGIERQKMLACLANSTILSLCKVDFEQKEIIEWLSELNNSFERYIEKTSQQRPNYTVMIYDICYFSPETIENMLKMALRYDAGVVSPTHRNDGNFSHAHLMQKWEINEPSPYMVLVKNDKKRSMKCCVDAPIFISSAQVPGGGTLDEVSTIIRFSSSGNMKLLQNALYSLLAQVGCKVHPIIAIQDSSEEMLADLEIILRNMPWEDGCYPAVRKYFSTVENRDLRSLMLNDSLQAVKTKYAAFLDYDDIMFHDAYMWLIERLRKTGKNATFGLLFNATFNLAENKIKARQVVYDYGRNYSDFLNNNHTPIHGFMLNMSYINPKNIAYFEDMKYLEDYYLTLQIFTKNDTDWESLNIRRFIGDYYHFEDKAQTLAVLDYSKRKIICALPDYRKNEARINLLRQKIMGKKL